MMKVTLSVLLFFLFVSCSLSNTKTDRLNVDENSTFFTLEEYHKIFYDYLQSEEIKDVLGEVMLNDLALLREGHVLKYENYIKMESIELSKSYSNVVNITKDKAYIAHFAKDETSKLHLFIHNKKRAIVLYPGGDDTCIWSNNSLIILNGKKLDILYIGGYSAMTGGAIPIFMPSDEYMKKYNLSLEDFSDIK